MSENLLKPCPFCGSGVKVRRNLAEGIYIFCPNDDCVMPDIEAEEPIEDDRVCKMWNTRKLNEALIKALQEAIADCREHNADYHWRTSEEQYSRWQEALREAGEGI